MQTVKIVEEPHHVPLEVVVSLAEVLTAGRGQDGKPLTHAQMRHAVQGALHMAGAAL